MPRASTSYVVALDAHTGQEVSRSAAAPQRDALHRSRCSTPSTRWSIVRLVKRRAHRHRSPANCSAWTPAT